MKARLPVIMLGLLAVTGVAGVASGAESPASTTQAQSFTLQRGEHLSGLCAQIRQAGINVTVPDCVRQILACAPRNRA